MDKIVDFKDRAKSRREQQRREQRRKKVEAIQKVTQCCLCHFRCARCGLHIKPEDVSQGAPSSSEDYTFCESCRREFEDFLSISKGKNRSGLLWQNKEWEKMWSAWINYQQAITAFVNSPEFKCIIEDFDDQP